MPAKDDLSDTLAQAQAKAAEADLEEYRATHCVDCDKPNAECRCDYGERRCIFHHSVPANQGFEIKAGFVCYGHSSEFDNAG